jgi:metal-responsive CopG/Arc/MetJ family transcriptional regulator
MNDQRSPDPDEATGVISVVLPVDLIAQIDALVGSGEPERDAIIRTAVRRYLDHLQTVGNSDSESGK